jgi:hypothetical protein
VAGIQHRRLHQQPRGGGRVLHRRGGLP